MLNILQYKIRPLICKSPIDKAENIQIAQMPTMILQ